MRGGLVAACFLIGAYAYANDDSLRLSSFQRSIDIESLWDSGNKSEARQLLEKWMRDEKSSPWPLVQSAALQYRQKKYKSSLATLKKALEKSPQCAEAYYWRGKNFEAQNKPLDAANEYRAAVIAEQSYLEAQEALTRVLGLLGS